MGVIAYEMVTGRRPFNPVSAPQLLELHREGIRVKPIDLRSGVSTEAQAIILRALSFERTERYQSAAEFGDCLARALLNEDETAPQHAASYSAQLTGAETLRTNSEGAPAFAKPDSFSETTSQTENRQFKLGKTQLLIIGGFLIVLIGVLGVLLILKGSSVAGNENTANRGTAGPTESSTLPAHSFIFSLHIQRMRDKKAYQNEFKSSDQDTFDTGDKFYLEVKSRNPGYVYIFNEGTPEPNRSSFTILYPLPSMNAGSASVGADQSVQTRWNKFEGKPGKENLWLIWSIAAVPELESAKTEAFKNNGMLTGPSLDAAKTFLTTKEKESKAGINRDKITKQTTVHGTGDVIVRMLQLEHR